MKKRDRIFTLIEDLTACIKYNGIFKGMLISYHALKIRFLKQRTTDNIYDFLNLKIKYYDYNSLIIMFYEMFCLNQYYFKTNAKNPVIIDIGANIGDSVLYFKWLYPKATIYSFEPHPKAFRLLEKNIELNNFTGVHIFNAGLSNVKGKLKLYDMNDYTFSSATTNKNIHKLKNKNYVTVAIDKISNFHNIMQLSEIDLIKIDVEGAESPLLKDLKILLPKTKKIIIEYHLQSDINKNSFDDIINTLKKYHLNPCVIGFYRNSNNYTNPEVFLITGEKQI